MTVSLTVAEAKAKFKDYVNKLATLVTDPQSGDKFVVLRPEVREQRRSRQPMVVPQIAQSGLPLGPNHHGVSMGIPQSSGPLIRAAYPAMGAPQSAVPQQPPRALQPQPPVPPPHNKGKHIS